MRKIIPLLATVLVFAAGGCRSIMQGIAEEPYRKAMKDGRMLPSEYMKAKEEIRKASAPEKSASVPAGGW
jgi:hypothetical protein